MATTIGQAKAIIRRKFDESEKKCSFWMAARDIERKEKNYEALKDADNFYHYWLGKRTILSELLTSIDEV